MHPYIEDTPFLAIRAQTYYNSGYTPRLPIGLRSRSRLEQAPGKTRQQPSHATERKTKGLFGKMIRSAYVKTYSGFGRRTNGYCRQFFFVRNKTTSEKSSWKNIYGPDTSSSAIPILLCAVRTKTHIQHADCIAPENQPAYSSPDT